MQHIFISPENLRSPRWQQAFASVIAQVDVPKVITADSLLWVFIVDETSLQAIADLSARGLKVVALTAVESPQEARMALAAGASGYLHYLAVPELLTQVVTVVTAAGLWLGSELMRQLITATAKQLPAAPEVDLSSLTARECLVAKAVASGKANKEVATELAITERTVKAHLGAIFEKLQVRDRLQLVLLLSGKM